MSGRERVRPRAMASRRGTAPPRAVASRRGTARAAPAARVALTTTTARATAALLALVTLTAALLATSAPAAAQVDLGFGAGAAFERYDFSDAELAGIESLSLLSFPFVGRADLTPRLRLDLNGAYAIGTLSRPGEEESSVSGPTDTELRLSYAFGADRVVVSLVALLPTGLATLSTEEADVAGAVAADVLPFRISNWGTGGGLGASTAFAVPVGAFAVGLSLGYVVTREYEPRDADPFTYRPGDQLHVRAAIDRSFGAAGKASLQLVYQHYQNDELDGANLYQSGDRLQATGSYAFAAGPRAAGIVYLGYLRRSEGEFSGITRIVPAQDLVFTGGGFRVPFGSILLAPSLDLRLVSRADGAEEGYTAAFGVAAEMAAGSVLLVPSLRGRVGNVVLSEGVESGFTGFDIGFGVRFGGF